MTIDARRPVAGARRAVRQTVAAVVACAALATSIVTLPTSTAAYTAVTDAGGAFDAAPCFFRSNVQSGTVVSSVDGVTTVAIAAVDPAKAFLVFTSRHDSNRPVGSAIAGQLTSATTLEFTRSTNESPPVPMTVEWSVVEYPCGVRVQRGEAFQTTATFDVPITPVASLGQAFLLWSKHPHNLDVLWSDDDPLVGELTSPGNVQFRADALNVNHAVSWQVVEFTDPTTVLVQRGTTGALVGATTVTTATLATPVDPSRSFVLAGARSPGPGTEVASGLVRARLTGAATVTLDRGATNYDVTEATWQVVELRDGSRVQSGDTAFATGVSTAAAAISPVDPTRATAFAPIQSGGGQNAGRTNYLADDVVGVAAAAMRVTSPTQLTLTRDSTAGDADIAWFVVSWGLP